VIAYSLASNRTCEGSVAQFKYQTSVYDRKGRALAMTETEQQQVISPVWAIIVVFLTFILFLFVGAAIYVLFGSGPTMVLGELLLIVIPLGYMLFRRIPIKRYIGLDIKPKYVLLGISFGVFLFLFDLVISDVLVLIFGVSEAVQESQQLVQSTIRSPEGLVLVVLSLALAGVCEEFTFRGFLQTAINSKHSFGIALFISSLAFGLFHFDPQVVYTLSAFLMGLMLGFIYHRWHSYVVSAIAHATINLIVLAIVLFIP
jgi:membrane protease YdiL (CAAX protease family)